MALIEVGAKAPAVPGVAFGDGPVALLFYKDSCPVCQMTAPLTAAFEAGAPGRLVGVGQDDEGRRARFASTYGFASRSVGDLPPYDVSNAYGIVSVPTLVLVGRDGVVAEKRSWLLGDIIHSALDQCRGNLSEAARTLGLTRRGLYLKLRRLGIETQPGATA